MSRANAAPVKTLANASVAHLHTAPAEPAPATRGACARASLRLWLRSTHLAEAWPGEGLWVPRLPFVIGRLPEATEKTPRNHVDLRLPDAPPYRLSRIHFCLMMLGDAIAVMDTNSHCGTVVNGLTIGRGRPRNHARLIVGMNRIVVGRQHEPFVFEVAIG